MTINDIKIGSNMTINDNKNCQICNIMQQNIDPLKNVRKTMIIYAIYEQFYVI